MYNLLQLSETLQSDNAYNYYFQEVINRDTDGHKWQTIKSHIRLVHVNTSQALKVKLVMHKT